MEVHYTFLSTFVYVWKCPPHTHTHTTTTVTNHHISKGTVHLSKKSFDFPKCQFSPLLFPYEVRYVYRPQTLTTSSGYSSLQTPLYLCDAHINKLVCFSLVHLFFYQLLYRAPGGEPRSVGGNDPFPSPTTAKEHHVPPKHCYPTPRLREIVLRQPSRNSLQFLSVPAITSLSKP